MFATMVAPFLLPKHPLVAQEAKVSKAIHAAIFFSVAVIYMLPIILTVRHVTVILIVFFLLRAAALVSF